MNPASTPPAIGIVVCDAKGELTGGGVENLDLERIQVSSQTASCCKHAAFYMKNILGGPFIITPFGGAGFVPSDLQKIAAIHFRELHCNFGVVCVCVTQKSWLLGALP